MQPETIKVNGEKPADIKTREFTPIENWDHLAFQVIYKELVPQGFKKVKNGKYKGSEFVEVPKKGVLRVQRIAAQLVRGYREKVKEVFKKDRDLSKDEFEKAKDRYINCPWYKFKLKKHLRHKADGWSGIVDTYEEVIHRLDQTPIK